MNKGMRSCFKIAKKLNVKVKLLDITKKGTNLCGSKVAWVLKCDQTGRLVPEISKHRGGSDFSFVNQNLASHPSVFEIKNSALDFFCYDPILKALVI